MRVIRWIIFIPAFVLGVALTESLQEIVLNKMYVYFFPLTSFWDSVFFLLWLSLYMSIGLSFYGWSIYLLLKICPDFQKGAAILFWIMLFIAIVDCVFRFNEIYFSRVVLYLIPLVMLFIFYRKVEIR